MGEDALFLQGHVPVLQGHQIAPEGGVAGPQRDAGGGGLHGGAPGKIGPGVAAKDGQNGGLAAGGQGGGAVDHPARQPPGGHAVDGGDGCGLEGRFAPQLGHRVVRHAVPDHEQIFDRNTSYWLLPAIIQGRRRFFNDKSAPRQDFS